MHSYSQQRQSATHVEESYAHRVLTLCLPVFRLLLIYLAIVTVTPAYSDVSSKQQPSELDSNIQAITYEAIQLISQLQQLEDQLLYPAHTRVSVFFSIEENSSIDPHSVSLEIDNGRITDHIYTQREVSALRSGGIQRLYTGNILMGKHKLHVNFRQARKDGNVRQHELEYKFTKDERAENIEIIIGNVSPHITVKDRN